MTHLSVAGSWYSSARPVVDHFSSPNLLWHGQEWQCKCVHGWGGGGWGGEIWHTHKNTEGLWEGRGRQPGCIVVRLLWGFFIGAILTTRGRVFPRCSAEQSGHLILTDTNTRTHRRKHAETHSRVDTQCMPPAAVANDVSPDLAKLAFCFPAWTQKRGGGFVWQCSKSCSVS